MRWLVLAPLALAGCNQIFGLEPTIAVDAAPSETLPPGPRTKLVWAIATTDGMLPAPPAAQFDPELVYKPIGSEPLRPELPTVMVGDQTGLMAATYDVTDGSFEIPFQLKDSPHRIVYTLPGESVPHEVQWSLTGATLTVPRTTRADAPRVPDPSAFTITPAGAPNGLSSPAVFTSGVFTDDEGATLEQSGNAITYRYSQYVKPVAGAAAAVESAKGDWVMITDAGPRSSTQTSVTGWALAQVDLAQGMVSHPATEPTWSSTTRTMSTLATCPGPSCLPQYNVSGTAPRLDNVVGMLGTPGGTQCTTPTKPCHVWYGVSPSTSLPGFVPGGAPSYLPRPLMLPFLESTTLDSSLTLADPSASMLLERVLAVRIATSRTADGVTLTSSIQTITTAFSGTIQYPAPLVQNIMLGATSLSGDQSDDVPLPGSSSMQKLRFEPEAGFAADDYVVTLYEINSGALAPVRIYHVIKPEVAIDGTLLASGHTYVLGITARAGLGGAHQGDYKVATYPFGSTTTFPRTFVVQ
jgi:hypothetical protein